MTKIAKKTTKPNRTPEVSIALINKMCNNKLGDAMNKLSLRWQDEKQFEDIRDYAKPLLSSIPKGLTFVKMSKRPFGFLFTVDAFPEAEYLCYLNASGVFGWKRTKY